MGNQILTPDLLIKFIKPIDSLVEPVRKIISLINIIISNIEMQNITSGIRLPENKIPKKKIIGSTIEIRNFCLSSFFQTIGIRMRAKIKNF